MRTRGAGSENDFKENELEVQCLKNPVRYAGGGGRKRGFSGSPNHISKERHLCNYT